MKVRKDIKSLCLSDPSDVNICIELIEHMEKIVRYLEKIDDWPSGVQEQAVGRFVIHYMMERDEHS